MSYYILHSPIILTNQSLQNTLGHLPNPLPINWNTRSIACAYTLERTPNPRCLHIGAHARYIVLTHFRIHAQLRTEIHGQFIMLES